MLRVALQPMAPLHVSVWRAGSFALPQRPFLVNVQAVSAHTYQNPVEGRGRPAPLHVAEYGHTCVIAQLLHHQLRGHTQEVSTLEGKGWGLTEGSPLFPQIYAGQVPILKFFFLKDYSV